jgi:hypothetical protein
LSDGYLAIRLSDRCIVLPMYRRSSRLRFPLFEQQCIADRLLLRLLGDRGLNARGDGRGLIPEISKK